MMSNFTVDERLSPTAEIKTSTAHAPPKHDNQHCKLVSITLPNVGPQGLILSEQDDGKSLIIEEVIPQSQAEKRGVLAGDVPILLLNNFSSSVCRVHKISYDTFLQRARDERPFVFSVLRDTTDKSGSSSMNQSSIEEGAPSREKIDGACETNNINMDMEDIRITNTENVGQDYLANISGSAVVEDTSVELAAAAAFTSRTTNFTSLKNIHPPPPSSNPVPPTITDSTNTEQKTKISIRELEVYMKTWIANPENASALNLMPSTSQKNQIVLETGIERSRLESWLYRTRQRLIVAREKENQVGLLSAAEVATIISSSSLGPAGIPKPLTEEAKRGLTKWIEEHQIHPFPSRGEKDAFKKLYGIENDPQLDGFLCRARKKYEKNLHNNGTKRGNDISSSGSISISAVVSEASTPSVHSATTTNNNNAITPGSSMKLPKKKYDNVTPAKRFVARPSEFGLKNSDGDKAATPSIYNVQTPRHGAVSDQTTFRTQCLSKTAAYEKIEIPTINNERQELDQVVLDSSIAVQADTQVVSIETISNLNDEEPYIGSRYPSSVQPSRRVVASTDYYPGCNLRGAHPLPGSAKYKSIIFYEGNRYSLGKYEFVSDAALAYDKAALSIGPYWDINFASWDEYIATRTLEVMRKGRDQVDLTSVLEVMSSRASEVVSKVVDEAELNDFEWNQQSLGSTASVNHDERVKAYETARALYLSHSKLSSRNIKEEEYHVQEKVYAWDRGALYEAKVLKYKEADDDNESLQYFIHYLGYKSCHDKWLSPKDMMKLNSLNKRFYCQSRGILFMENEVVSHEDESFSYDEEKDNNLDQISVFSASSCGKQSRVSSEGFLSDAEWPVNRDGSNSLTQSTLSQSISLGLPNVKRGRGRQKKAKSQKRTKKSSSNSLPPGVNETTSGNYQVQVYYQGNNRNIGSFKTLESATLVSEIVRNMLKKDKGQQLSVVECERNVKLAKEAALAGVPNNEMCSKVPNVVGDVLERISK